MTTAVAFSLIFILMTLNLTIKGRNALKSSVCKFLLLISVLHTQIET